jgi:recombination protein RecA
VEPMAGTDREKALDAALAQIERQFGKGAVMRMGERSKEPIEAFVFLFVPIDFFYHLRS